MSVHLKVNLLTSLCAIRGQDNILVQLKQLQEATHRIQTTCLSSSGDKLIFLEDSNSLGWQKVGDFQKGPCGLAKLIPIT